MSAALQAPRTVRTANAGSFLTVCLLVLLAALAVPYLAIIVAGGGLVRTIYPAYILCVALFVMTNRRPLYPAFMIAVFAFSPFIRRVADYQAGFATFSLILLGPYIGLLPTVPALLRRAFGGCATLNWPFAAILVCVIYAAFLAMFRLAFIAAAFEGMKWLLPTALAAFIMAKPTEAETVRRSVIQALCLVMPILTVYGVYQFLYAPLWDVYWMWNVDNPTFGVAEAFKIRVFSMMNSPGTVSVFGSYAMILLAGEGVAAAAVAVCSLPLLALTLLRSAWLSVAVGLVALIVQASAPRRLILLSGIACIGFAAAAIFASPELPPEISNIVSERLSTFSSLATDTSADDRLGVYKEFFSRLDNSLMGEGFGANASTVSTHEVKGSLASIDSGLLETFLIYGLFGGVVYFMALATLLMRAWRSAALLKGRLNANFAVLVAMVAILPLGTSHIGEIGILVWMALGTLFAQTDLLPEGSF
jgi:hypothetical protein